MAKQIGGKFIDIELRENGSGDPFQTLVCTESSSFEISTETSVKRTNCGISTTVSDATATASGTAVQNIIPTSSEVSYEKMKEWIISGKKVDFRYFNQADTANGILEGAAIENTGSAYVTSLTLNAAADPGEGVTFDWTLTQTGNIDEYDES